MLDELIFVPEVVWTYLWQINFFSPEILKVPLGTGLLKSKKKIAAEAAKKCAPHGSCGEPRFMNCSWIIQLVHELFMNMFKFLLRIFGYFQTLEHLLNMFMNSSWTCSKKEKNLDWRPWMVLSTHSYCLNEWRCRGDILLETTGAHDIRGRQCKRANYVRFRPSRQFTPHTGCLSTNSLFISPCQSAPAQPLACCPLRNAAGRM